MSSFEQGINSLRQFIIAVKVFPPTQNQNDYAKALQNAVGYRALVDTGANGCSISKKVVSDLALRPYSEQKVMTSGEIHIAPVYLVGLAVAVQETRRHLEKQSGDSTIMKPFVTAEISKGRPEIKVTTFPDVGIDRGFDAILGMDLLMDFHITLYRGKIIISV